MLSRRLFLSGLPALIGLGSPTLAPRSASAEPPAPEPQRPPHLPQDLEIRDLSVPGDRALGRRFTLLVPKHLAAGEKVPLLVLLHGLGETGDERMGAFAWLERYGLGTAYDRLRRPPLARTSKRADWTAARLAEVNSALATRPFRGLALACPFTPTVYKAPDPVAALDG
ncbi:MAG TPA: hypothetical protein VLS89_16675, partial [Candidatus Nanopelagicales bacterium]|nr:hypothetical protein [Candidatus Nanopelagicales bacterium]